MFPTASPRLRRIARQLLLLPVLVAALLVAIVPAPAAGPKHDVPGAAAVQAHQPLFAGDGRKIK